MRGLARQPIDVAIVLDVSGSSKLVITNGLPAALTADDRFLTDLAAQTGGRVRDGEAGAGLAGAFRQSLEQFRGRYEIAYTASGKEPGWHAVDVRVPGPPRRPGPRPARPAL
ncbi:MAG: hypothetical protein ABIT71_26790 [Vicinamibacteraceae bacterium]